MEAEDLPPQHVGSTDVIPFDPLLRELPEKATDMSTSQRSALGSCLKSDRNGGRGPSATTRGVNRCHPLRSVTERTSGKGHGHEHITALRSGELPEVRSEWRQRTFRHNTWGQPMSSPSIRY